MNHELKTIMKQMEPEEALRTMVEMIKELLPLLDEKAKVDYVVKLLGETGSDKVASLVDLWLAECMDEGVDPTKMCQTLVDKVNRSKQLRAVTEPEILVLFENWLDELEEEIVAALRLDPDGEPLELAEKLGLSKSGARFFVSKLEKEQKI